MADEPEDSSNSKSRKERKEEGKLRKRQRIEESGGVRPRSKEPKNSKTKSVDQKGKREGNNKKKKQQKNHEQKSQHRFGRVMDQVPCRNKPRFSTLSIALPGSVLSNCQTRELKTHLVGQIARACTIYHVDEVVVFDDKLSKRNNNNNKSEANNAGEKSVDFSCAFLSRVLQYCECPQYLRRTFFPQHPDLQFAGLLPPIDAPHHVRAEDRCKYREGAVLKPKGNEEETSNLVNCGVRNRPIVIDRSLPPGIRCTVELDPKDYGRPGKKMSGKVVSPAAPREDNGTYWGYTTRIADSIQNVFEECPFEGGYDLKIGTSERGDANIEDPKFSLPQFAHSLIVFGGVAGIEECIDADETSKLPGSESKNLFDLWVNICPFQGSRTIRTEEAVLIGLAKFSPHLATSGATMGPNNSSEAEKGKGENAPVVEFSDGAVSEESSDSNSEDSE
ncbi:Putative methyltransferase C9orf114 [Seminavis robusta]|uniref:Methyltransferase C9orf114 n=1 Tax=Seminavis robusta TaxID=568900 RepID=A0A9N8EGS6_9STRA|nr:Putative methyltransferase C9orf114 [Seminavis robusta]|eukprot:Sro979_g227280.1 Putative methyltransferase C9orf114 (447) ;mRNA; r:24388-25922